jgi:hypothetical protein
LDAAEVEEPDAAPSASAEATDSKPPESSGTSTASKATTSKPAAGSGSGGTSKTSGGAGGGDACAQCLNAATNGNISLAASAFRRCTDPKGKQDCQTAARKPATVAVEAAAASGNCGAAKALANAAASMGATHSRMTRAVKKCK